VAVRIVLLHSPLLGPMCWRGVADELRMMGRAAHTPAWPRLSSLGGDCYRALAAGLAATLDVDRKTPAVLVAHSGAGPLTPSVAAYVRGPIRGVIFCDALLPHPGDSWFDTAPPELAAQLRAGADEARLPRWSDWWPPGALERLVPDAELRGALVEELEPIPVGYFEELLPEIQLSAPCAYLQLSGAYIEEAKIAGRKGWPVVSLPLHHLAMLTHPAAVAGAIAGLVEKLEASDE
jgi:hypothetical protein